jgi:hypothetical protein
MRKMIIVLVYVAAVPIGLAIGRYYDDFFAWWSGPAIAVPASREAGEPPRAGPESARPPVIRDVDVDTGAIRFEGPVTATVTDGDGETRRIRLEDVTIRPSDDESSDDE